MPERTNEVGNLPQRYMTFINPEPNKGVYVFARIACELARRRPDIPLLVTQGRSRADALRDPALGLGPHLRGELETDENGQLAFADRGSNSPRRPEHHHNALHARSAGVLSGRLFSNQASLDAVVMAGVVLAW